MEQLQSGTPAAHEPLDFERQTPALGLIPRAGFERFILAWAVANVCLTLLPVFTTVGNGTEMVAGILPLTIFWSYAIFLSNVALGLVYFIVRAWPWARRAEAAARDS